MSPTPAQIRADRKARGLSQAKAAALLGVPLGTWISWESTAPSKARNMPPAKWALWLLTVGPANPAPP